MLTHYSAKRDLYSTIFLQYFIGETYPKDQVCISLINFMEF
jgi:hypothetical protein